MFLEISEQKIADATKDYYGSAATRVAHQTATFKVERGKKALEAFAKKERGETLTFQEQILLKMLDLA